MGRIKMPITVTFKSVSLIYFSYFLSYPIHVLPTAKTISRQMRHFSDKCVIFPKIFFRGGVTPSPPSDGPASYFKLMFTCIKQ
jgi:hypothetical protein